MEKTYLYHILYKMTHIDSGRYYIGVHSTNDLKDDYTGSGTKWKRIYKKYGAKQCTKEIFEYCDTRKQALDKEKEIVNNNLLKDHLCCNLRTGGTDGNYQKKLTKDFHHSEESKKRQSEAMRGEKNPNFGKHSHMFGKHHSEESKLKQRLAKLGKKHTEDHKNKISETLSGENSYWYGKHHSEETKKRQSEVKRGKKCTEEQKKKTSETLNLIYVEKKRRLYEDLLKLDLKYNEFLDYKKNLSMSEARTRSTELRSNPSHVLDVINYYLLGFTMLECAERFNVSVYCIQSIAKENKIQR